MDLLKFVALDDTTHVIGPGEYTVCGIVIPQGETYTTDQPKKLCADCKARIKDTDEFGVTKTAFEEAAPEALNVEPPAEAPKATKEAAAPKAKATSAKGKA
jgi:hypothetical protein